jgi:hypothetical protein
MKALSPPGRHHGLWYVLIYYVLEGKEKRLKEKRQRQKEIEKEIDVNFYLNLLFIRFYFFTHSTDFFLFYDFYMEVFCYQHLLVFCTISEMADILPSALTGMCFYYYVQLCFVMFVVCGNYWYFFICCQHLLACCLIVTFTGI